MRIIDKNINEQKKALYRNTGGGNVWRKLGEKGKQQVLTDKEILELSELILKIENHYGFPCDIEWATEGGKFYIVQSRPITTLGGENSIPLRPTVKRDLSLFSVEAWEKGYRRYFKESWGEPYNILFHYDGEKVNFYHTLPDFDYFKNVITERLIKDNKLFNKLNIGFLDDVARLKRLLPKISSKNLGELSETIGKIMSFYIFVVSDAFVKEKPIAWKSREISEVVLYEADEQVGEFLGKSLSQRRKNPSLAHYLSLEEIGKIIDGNSLKLSEIGKRKRGYIWQNGEIITDINFADYWRERGLVLPVENLSLAEVKSIHGEIAFKGKVQGIVRIVKNKKDFSRVKDGDVLVAVMTNATYLPFLHKAAAFVTDEGGITCHAAIIARELKKPCIIGTKIATQVLHDGDLVEVDANEGVVRVVKKVKR